ncbi:MAG: serine/threonine protein kinase [Deltaproteobacteria bacterium]|nr:serine/threonine protein kinase [Deltaproteobacteria bacterium]
MATGIRDNATAMGSQAETSSRYLGRIIAGRYRVDRVISDGGMGVVCEATQVPLNRRVALKLLSPTLRISRDEFTRRFHLEAATLARLIHPNVVTIHDYGQTEDDDLYLTMEFLAGRSLAAVIAEEGPLPWVRLLQIATQICRGLREAHALGIAHRDLKPANVMILPGDEDAPDHVKILDFGLAKLLNPDEPPQTDLARSTDPREVTSRIYLHGSPRYMSPEQIVGGPLNHQTDIYSLGAVLFTMATGVPPFDGATAIDIIHQHVNALVPPVSEMGYRRSCPPQLEEVILHCMEKDPDRRFANVNDVLAHLKRLLQRLGGPEAMVRGTSSTDLPTGLPTVRPRAPVSPGPQSRSNLLTPTGPIEGVDIIAISPNLPKPPLLDPPPDLKAALSGPPESFGQYRLLGMVAQGGMGRLYLAEKQGGHKRSKLVALKRVLPHLAGDPELRRMFLTEAKVAASLEHSNIVTTYEFGEVQGQPFIAMEYLAGEDLETVLSTVASGGRGRMPIEFATSVARNCARGLHYAHEMLSADGKSAGVVHRDVNPSNIFVTYDGEVKLLDFGVAKVRAREATRAGTFKGKLGYSSPEQLSGAPVDRRTDIFCLGIVLWECLTGTQLFEGDSDAGKVEAVRAKRIWPPSALRPQIPRDLDEVCLRALARNPSERYESAAEMAAALEQCLERQTSGTEDLIGNWLVDLFPPERVATKQALASADASDLLSTIQAQEPVISAPPPPPPPTRDETLTTDSLSSVRPLLDEPGYERGPRNAPVLMAVAVALISLGLGGAWLLYGRSSPPPPASPMARALATAEITSEPPGAMIFVDGEPTGMTTPNAVRNLPTDREVKVRVTRAGFAPDERTLRPQAGEKSSVNFTLRPSQGTVRFEGVASAARVYVDDTLVNVKSPIELPIGSHQLRVELGDELIESRTFVVQPGEQLERVRRSAER